MGARYGPKRVICRNIPFVSILSFKLANIRRYIAADFCNYKHSHNYLNSLRNNLTVDNMSLNVQ